MKRKLPNPYYQDDLVTIYHGDCREILPSLKGISAVITDPPYELGFMGKSWDSKGVSFQIDTWRLIKESCLPDAPLLSFGGTRTSHRIACAIEDAGWQIRDTICWVYGSGFPKSLDISRAIDYDACREQLTKGLGRKPTKDELKEAWLKFREVVGIRTNGNKGGGAKTYDDDNYLWDKPFAETKPATPEAKLWEGYGTGLKPSYEPIILAMKPIDGTFANNALEYGVAGLNIDECRIKSEIPKRTAGYKTKEKSVFEPTSYGMKGHTEVDTTKGRFPANFIHDGSQEVMELFPNTKGAGNIQQPKLKGKEYKGSMFGAGSEVPYVYDRGGSAARFFYCAKSSRRERDAGLEGMPTTRIEGRDEGQDERNVPYKNRPAPQRNQHPTVKPLALMTYLCKLVKMPEYNLILDPFCGSGSTLLACKKLGIKAIGIDSNEEYCEIASKRLKAKPKFKDYETQD